jgi:hypothetical protein
MQILTKEAKVLGGSIGFPGLVVGWTCLALLQEIVVVRCNVFVSVGRASVAVESGFILDITASRACNWKRKTEIHTITQEINVMDLHSH